MITITLGVALQLPLVLLFSSTIISAVLGAMYAGALWYVLSSTIIGRRFCVDLYRATLHIERLYSWIAAWRRVRQYENQQLKIYNYERILRYWDLLERSASSNPRVYNNRWCQDFCRVAIQQPHRHRVRIYGVRANLVKENQEFHYLYRKKILNFAM